MDRLLGIRLDLSEFYEFTHRHARLNQLTMRFLGLKLPRFAKHFCMMMRGVEKQHSGAMTSTMLGAFRDRKETRNEFLSLVNHQSGGY